MNREQNTEQDLTFKVCERDDWIGLNVGKEGLRGGKVKSLYSLDLIASVAYITVWFGFFRLVAQLTDRLLPNTRDPRFKSSHCANFYIQLVFTVNFWEDEHEEKEAGHCPFLLKHNPTQCHELSWRAFSFLAFKTNKKIFISQTLLITLQRSNLLEKNLAFDSRKM